MVPFRQGFRIRDSGFGGYVRIADVLVPEILNPQIPGFSRIASCETFSEICVNLRNLWIVVCKRSMILDELDCLHCGCARINTNEVNVPIRAYPRHSRSFCFSIWCRECSVAGQYTLVTELEH